MKLKLIPKEKAIELAKRASKSDLTAKEQDLLIKLIDSCTSVSLPTGEYIREDHLRNFMANWVRAIKEKDSSFLYQPRGLCVDRIVDIEEFIESPYFMNLKGAIWPSIKNGLIEFFENDNYVEAVLGGAIGTGKSFFSELAMSYMLYRLSCYHNPQLEFGLAPGSSIIFIAQSKTLNLAKKVLFEQLTARLSQSEYFTQHFRFDPKVKAELRFPKNIYIVPCSGSDTAALGLNVFGAIIDELNFMAKVQDSVHTKHTGEDEYDQAKTIYQTIRRRIASRFMQKSGHIPGKLILVSSVHYPGDFTSMKMEEAKTDKTIFVLCQSQWEARPPESVDWTDPFYVEVGNEIKKSRILDTPDDALDPEDVIKVPQAYKPVFEANLDWALKDLAGVVAGTRNPFIPYPDLIHKAQTRFSEVYTRSLFKNQTLTLDFTDHSRVIDWEKLIVDLDYIEQDIINTNIPFVAHLDPGISRDAAALAVGHIAGYKVLPSTKYWDEARGEFIEVRDMRAPMYHIDGILRIIASKGNEVDLGMVMDLIFFLRQHINLKWATMDSYQAAFMIQSLKKAKIRSGVSSVDTSIAPYTELKLSIKDERIIFPPHEIASTELRYLELDPKKGKVDHPSHGSKDCSDAMAGCVYILQHKEAKMKQGRSLQSVRRQRYDSMQRPKRLVRI